jgi:hypothetical protein
VRQVVAPPMPDPAKAALPVVLHDPMVQAELWQQVPTDVPPADPAVTAVQLGMAVYFLQALHTPDKPGYEHLVRDNAEEDEEEDPNAAR